jgi:hypothetical protein
MHKIAIMQPYLFPYIGYFQLIKSVDTFIVYDDVNYIKGGWINRNNLLINGEKRLFTISLKQSSSYKLIKEIEIKDDFKKFHKTIQSSYGRAPYYKDVVNLLEEIIDYKNRFLSDFIFNSLLRIIQYLNIETEILLSSAIPKNIELTGERRVIDICLRMNATQYINAIGGKNLYDVQNFQKNGIELKFIEPELNHYKQFNNSFISGLSIIDVLMFNSIEDVNNLLNQYFVE